VERRRSAFTLGGFSPFFEFFYFPAGYMTVDVIYGILCSEVSREQISRPKENWLWN
jgi:hypothetical protein